MLNRSNYIPSGANKVSDKLSDSVAYLYTTADGRPAAVVFYGKATKPAWKYRFPNVSRRAAYVAEFFKKRREIAAQRQTRNAPHPLKEGDILYSSWGYEQTNIDYFKVSKVIGEKMVEIVEVEGAQTATGDFTGKVVATDNVIGAPMRRRASADGIVKIDSVRRAQVWDGLPRSYSTYG